MKGRYHFRRCHLCNEITNVIESEVKYCQHCGKPMAPFFYFTESQTMALSDVQTRPDPTQGEYQPLRGLTAFWEEQI